LDAPSATALNITRSTGGFKLPGDHVRQAVAEAARGLPAADPRAHVFFEEREDVRLTIGSDGLRNAMTSRSRGGVIAGRSSTHASDPEFMEPRPIDSAGREFDPELYNLEAAIVGAAGSAAAGRGNVTWLANVVRFHQVVWVARPDLEVVSDIRRGSRLEVRVQVGEFPERTAVQDLVLRSVDSAPIQAAFAHALERAEKRTFASATPKPGETTAVFAPGVAGIVVHELIGHALEGDVVARHGSWIAEAGLLSAAAAVTVTDDPRRGRGAWLIDDEGTATRATRLVERDRQVGLLLDRSAATALGKASTGHGRRSSYLDRIQPRMGCTFVESGVDDPIDILRTTPAGVFIRRLTGGHTDPLSGRATFIVRESDRIIDGRLAEPFDDFVIELSGSESWKTIDRVAHDLAFDTCVGSCVRDGQPLAVSVGAPTIRIGVVRVCS
jgi:TldD protein